MRTLIIDSNIPELCPYHEYYKEILGNNHDEIDVISWDRSAKLKDASNTSTFCYSVPSSENEPMFKKFFAYMKFSKYVINILIQNNYDLIIVCGLQNAYFLRFLLQSTFKNRYILDIRDYSPLYPLIKYKLDRIVNEARLNVISSYGYLKWLPSHNYTISHNVSNKLIEANWNDNCQKHVGNPIRVLTLGSLREFDQHKKLLESLGRSNDFTLIFAGDGIARIPLQDYAKAKKLKAQFSGWYNKEDEVGIAFSCDIINILLDPNYVGKTTPIANRLYTALICNKAVMVNPESIHAEFVDKYQIGIIIGSKDSIEEKVRNYFARYDPELYRKGRNDFLRKIYNENSAFQLALARIKYDELV